MNDPRPPESEVIIGRLRKKIVKLMEQRDGYKNELVHYREVLDHHTFREREYKDYNARIKERERVKALETRVKEQEELIKLLRKEE
jgi:ppGpp synthetase/RelA/SpoT-type nucleotidyltranferase